MTNSQILSLLDQLRLEYSAATDERKKEIIDEQSRLKSSLIRCAECQIVLEDDRIKLCRDCGNQHWANARKSTIVNSKEELIERMNMLKKKMYQGEEYVEVKKISANV